MKTKRNSGLRSIEALESRQLMAVLAAQAEVPPAWDFAGAETVAVASSVDVATEMVVGPQLLSKTSPAKSPGGQDAVKAAGVLAGDGAALLDSPSQQVFVEDGALSGEAKS